MKSGKQRKAEIKAARLLKAARTLPATSARAHVLHARGIIPRGAIFCDPAALAPNNSYGQGAYAYRGYYIDEPFRCRDCGADCIWNAERQKWWYEVAKGDIYSTATRCAPCRARERERKTLARLRMQQGLERKKQRSTLH